jgi:hypothetical protein
VLGEQDVQNRYVSRLSTFENVAVNPSVRKRRCLVTPCVPARRDGRYIYDKVTEWFEVISKVLQDLSILPENAYNMDETGVC